MSNVESARTLAQRAIAAVDADEAEAVAAVGSSALTRFADNRIHQNVAERDTAVSVRAVVGKRSGVASTNRTDDESLAACGAAAATAAAASPEDPDFPGLPGPEPIEQIIRTSPSTDAFDAEERARAVRSIVDQSSSRGLTAAGSVSCARQALAVANTCGVDAAMDTTMARATVLSTGTAGGTGWASFANMDSSKMAPAALGDIAAMLAERSENPRELEPGSYTVVLAPEAVSDLVDFLAYVGFSAQAVEEKRSFMSDRMGERVMSESVTIVDDALSPHAMGLTFDFEGQPKWPVSVIENGVAHGALTDSYWAARTGKPNTGHALPAPNAHGPLPLNLAMDPGDATIDELIASVNRGIYVTRFHYVNVEEPVSVLLTGMTRDGTFMIEDGHLTAPVRNQRFTQSVVDAFSNVRGLTSDREFSGTEFLGHTYVPGVLLDGFNFTGQTG